MKNNNRRCVLFATNRIRYLHILYNYNGVDASKVHMIKYVTVLLHRILQNKQRNKQ